MKRYTFYTILLGLVCSVFLFTLISGCVDQKRVKDDKKDTFFNKWKVKAETSKGYSPSAKRRVVDLEGRKVTPAEKEKAAEPEKTLPTQEISMTMHGVDVNVLLRTLARAAGINMLINENVTGQADVNIKKAPWDQVFHGVLSTHGLTYAWVGDIIRIMTLDDQEQDFKRQSQQQEFRLVQPIDTRVIQIDFAEAKKLQGNLEKFLTLGRDGQLVGSVLVDEHTNSLIIQAIAEDIDQMIPLIQELDRPTPQVLIEAHIVEATKTAARDLGVQWGGLYKNEGGVNHYGTAGQNSTGVIGQPFVDSAGTAQAINPTSGMVSNFPADAVTAAAKGLTIGYVYEDIGKALLTVQLAALEQEGKLNILSSPSITTVDNQKAILESGREVPYQSVEDGNVKIEFKDAKLRLEVTPHVIDGQMLKMDIKVENNEVDPSADPSNPSIIAKLAETVIVLRDGQTTVIGGLSKETSSDAESGVPFLKDIPGLGWLFKTEGKDKQMEELLIFITPHILQEHIAEAVQELPTGSMTPKEGPPESEPVPE
jgi:type IV pilus assembly protein PilQ